MHAVRADRRRLGLGQPVNIQGERASAPVRNAALRRVVSSNLVNNALRYGQRADVVCARWAKRVRIVIDDGRAFPRRSSMR